MPFTTTWTLADGTSTTYAGFGLVNRIVFATTAGAEGEIDVSDIYTYSRMGGTVKYLGLTIAGGAGSDLLDIRVDGSGIFSGASVKFEGWGAEDELWWHAGAGNPRITGTSVGEVFDVQSGHDVIAGGAGVDTLIWWAGGTSNFYMDGASRVTNGADLSITYSEVEKLSLFLGAGHDVVQGGAGDDSLYGGAGGDSLKGLGGFDELGGGAGNDVLNGGAGGGRLYGGDGDDIYVVESANTLVIEASAAEGRDQVWSAMSFTLGSHVDDLYLTGTAAANATGNWGANLLYGNTGANRIAGNGGRDDISVGGDGAVDTLVFNAVGDSWGANADHVWGFDAAGEDKLDFAFAVAYDGHFAASAPSGSSVTAQLDARFDAGGAIEAVSYSSGSGAQARTYVAVDADNNGSYATGSDYLIEFEALLGSFDTSDFV